MSRAVELISEQRRKNRWAKVFTSMAAVVVFCTTYALILPAITLEADPVCGMEEHMHGPECYETPTITDDPLEQCASAQGHTHGPECYQDESMTELICIEEELPPHICDETCVVSEGASTEEVLICAIPEHIHDTVCYPEVEEDTGDPSSREEELLEPADLTADLETQ